MSVQAMTWVFEHSLSELGARLVLIVLADHARADGSGAWPALSTLSREARLSERAVRYALRKLEDMGEIRCTGRTQRGVNVYALSMGRGANIAGEGGQILPPGGANGAPEPSLNPSPSERGKKILDTADEPIGFNDWLSFHSELSGRSVPREGTSYRSELARAFAALQSEGYSAEDFELASEGVVGDEFMRAGGHDKFDNVLRKSKIGGRIDDGKRARAARSSNKYAKFEEG